MAETLQEGIRFIRPSWARNEKFYLHDDFLILLARCRALGFSMYGVEAFCPQGELLDVVFGPDDDSDLRWVEQLLRGWPDSGTLFSGSIYSIEDEAANPDSKAENIVDRLEALLASRRR